MLSAGTRRRLEEEVETEAEGEGLLVEVFLRQPRIGHPSLLDKKGNSNSHGARPVYLIITMIKWIRTNKLSIKNSLSLSLYSIGR